MGAPNLEHFVSMLEDIELQVDGALVREQGVTFGIVVVKPHVIQSTSEAQQTIRSLGRTLFPQVPVVLMAQDHRGVATYYGRTDIVNFLANTPVSAIPWRRYTVN